MEEFSEPLVAEPNRQDRFAILKIFAGLSLLVLGVLAAFWVFFSVLLLLNHEPQPLIEKILGLARLERHISTPSGDIELSASVFFLIGVFAYLVAVTIIGAIAKSLITAGAHLLGNEFSTGFAKIHKELGAIKQTLKDRQSS